MRSWFTSALLGFTLGVLAGAPAQSMTVADQCPRYAVRLQQARDRLTRNDRAGAIAALRAAQAALGECIRRDAEESSAPVLIVAVPQRPRDAV